MNIDPKIIIGFIGGIAAAVMLARSTSIGGRAREGQDRGKGFPFTDAERQERHFRYTGEEDLPPRGTGLE